LKKAAQKLLLVLACGSETSTAQFEKFFCYFLFTKSSLLPGFHWPMLCVCSEHGGDAAIDINDLAIDVV
jgi:hypothetical protein